jgi:hypothetical protein
MMNKDVPFTVTEWEWLKLQLEIRTIRSETASLWIKRFNFDDENGKVICLIWCDTARKMVNKKASRDEQISFYETWVSSEQLIFKETLQTLPTLREQFNIEKDLVFQILFDYGMGSSLICEYRSGEFIWRD